MANNNQPNTSHGEELIKIEQQTLEAVMQKSPQALVRPQLVNSGVINEAIGIFGLPQRSTGYIRFAPQDFIVEERDEYGNIVPIDGDDQKIAFANIENQTVYADMIKIGLSTQSAIKQLADKLHIKPQNVAYAGLKDARAVTSQRISIRQADLELIRSIKCDQILLRPRKIGKGALSAGQLSGNHFSIFVRTDHELNQEEIMARVQELSENGYPNFYGVQRFGNRLINPLLGKLLCKGWFEEAIKIFLVEPGPFVLPLHKAVRAKAAESYGDWVMMKQRFDMLPYYFRHERILCDALIEHGNNWAMVLLALEEQVRFWVYGYASYLMNELLSRGYAGQCDIPDPLPIPFQGPIADELYASQLEADETSGYKQHVKKLLFFNRRERGIMPWIVPVIDHVAVTSAGVALSFDLSKAAYATTLLMFLFEIYEGTPVPEWVKNDEVDVKALLGTGQVASVLSRFNYIDKAKSVIPPEASPQSE